MRILAAMAAIAFFSAACAAERPNEERVADGAEAPAPADRDPSLDASNPYPDAVEADATDDAARRSPQTDAGVNEGPNERYVSETHDLDPAQSATDRSAAAGDRESELTWARAVYKTDYDRMAQIAFDRHDLNRDRILSESEYRDAVAAIGPSGPLTGTDSGPDSEDARLQPNDEAGLNTAWINAGANNGDLDRADLRTSVLERFDMADGDHNDELNAAEKAHFAALMMGREPDLRQLPPR